jgi:hypothetical protein
VAASTRRRPPTSSRWQADLLVVVTGLVSEIHHLAARLPSVKPRAVSLLVVGTGPGVTDVAEVVGYRSAPS